MSNKKWSTWNPFKPFGREVTEVTRILEAVLDGTVDPREWGDFLNIPMKGSPHLEAVRTACEALDSEETMDANGVIIYTRKGREKLQQLLGDLKNDI